MGKRKVTILESAAEEVAHIAFFIESNGMPATAKKFVDTAFIFFETLADDRKKNRLCNFPKWKKAGYRCANFKKKYVVALIDKENEIIIVDFALQKLLH